VVPELFPASFGEGNSSGAIALDALIFSWALQLRERASAPNPKFALPSRKSDCELRVQKGH